MDGQYSTLAYLLVVQILRGTQTLEGIKIEALREDVEAILSDKDLLVKYYVSRVVDGLETLESVPEMLRDDVESFLGTQSTSLLLLVADVIDGKLNVNDIVDETLREMVKAEVERYLGKKLDWED